MDTYQVQTQHHGVRDKCDSHEVVLYRKITGILYTLFGVLKRRVVNVSSVFLCTGQKRDKRLEVFSLYRQGKCEINLWVRMFYCLKVVREE